MTQHRWITDERHGRWCSTADEALFDALRSGQASLSLDDGDAVTLRPCALLEEQPVKYEAWRNRLAPQL
jgi:hypothetical protein